MANCRPGDHPLTDILIHGRQVYSPTADRLIREIVGLSGREEIADMLLLKYNDLTRLDIADLERVLTAIRDRLRSEAQQRGWEV